MQLARSIFKAYDIRGVVDDTLTEPVVRAIGAALGLLIHRRGRPVCVIGRDGRLSGPRLVDALASGLMDAGIDVIDIGQVPTPVVYFATVQTGCGTGVAVTDSHNPPQYNGLKMMVAGQTLWVMTFKNSMRSSPQARSRPMWSRWVPSSGGVAVRIRPW